MQPEQNTQTQPHTQREGKPSLNFNGAHRENVPRDLSREQLQNETERCEHRDAITCGRDGWLTCLDCGTDIPDIAPGQVWERQDGSRVRVQGFSQIEPHWIKVRELGGLRERSSYPRTPFYSGAWRRVDV